jgi:hypothetical protein
MKLIINLTGAILSFMLLLTACEKEVDDWTYSTDDTMTDLNFNDLYNTMRFLNDDNQNSGSCANLTLSKGAFPITVTADFNGCTSCRDKKLRSGNLTAIYSGRWNTPGTVISITTNNYTVNGYKIEGTYIITNTSTSENTSFNSEVQNGKITNPEGTIILRNLNKNYALITDASRASDILDIN